MKIKRCVGFLALALLLSGTAVISAAQERGANFVRWDIIHLNPTTTPPTVSPGGVAGASARNPNTLSIALTGSGTFVAPASGGTSSAVTGGGTWETFSNGVSTGSGTYEVRELVSWQFDNFQSGAFIDQIDDGTRVNGNAVLRIEYSDGSEGVLGVGCHGPGADPGIVEGVIATKGYKTYWDAHAPVAGPFVDANRTIFHAR